MDITIHASFLPQDDPDAALAFWRDTLGFEVRNDVGYGGMRWLTVGPPGQPGTSIVLGPPAVDPGVTEDERRTVTEVNCDKRLLVTNRARPRRPDRGRGGRLAVHHRGAQDAARDRRADGVAG
jgi:catechol 2,3-dioxygenase-like lactoylglutathione lyase family enzyme